MKIFLTEIKTDPKLASLAHCAMYSISIHWTWYTQVLFIRSSLFIYLSLVLDDGKPTEAFSNGMMITITVDLQTQTR